MSASRSLCATVEAAGIEPASGALRVRSYALVDTISPPSSGKWVKVPNHCTIGVGQPAQTARKFVRVFSRARLDSV